MYDHVIFSAYMNEYSSYFSAGEYLEGFTGFLINFGNGFSLSNGGFTAQRNGNYEFSAAALHSNIEQGSNDLTVEHNGAQVLLFHSWEYSGNPNTDTDTMSFSWIMELKQGDVVRLKVSTGRFYCGPNYNCIFSGKYI